MGKERSTFAYALLYQAMVEEDRYALAQVVLHGAEASYHEALRLNPNYADAHANLANAYKEQGCLEEAIASYQQALWLSPDSPSAHWNRSLAWLQNRGTLY